MVERRCCADHPEVTAAWGCSGCGRGWCPECVRSHVVNRVTIWNCPLCGGDCEPTGVGPIATAASGSFASQLAGAFAYPVKGRGLWMLLLGPLLFTGVFFVLRYSIFGGIFGLVVAVGVAGYLCAYLVKIVRCSASGDAEPPDWPELGAEEILRPLGLLLLAVLLYGLPAIIAEFSDASEWTVIALRLAGACFLPMAVAIVAIVNSFAALNPVLAVRSILRVPLEYLAVLVTLAVVVVVREVVEYSLEGRLVLVGELLQNVVGFYFLMVQMRVLGVMYKANEEKLGWF